MMTKELHDKLTKYEAIFRTAIDAKYYRAMDSRFAADFISACKELNVHINISCPQCVLKALQAVGKLYFEYKEPEVLDEVKDEDNKTNKEEKKTSQNASKQPKKTIVTKSKTKK